MAKIYTRSMLRKRKPSSFKAFGKNILPKDDQTIIAFTEEVSRDQKNPDASLSTELNAQELFGIFTADIIKTNVFFIR